SMSSPAKIAETSNRKVKSKKARKHGEASTSNPTDDEKQSNPLTSPLNKKELYTIEGRDKKDKKLKKRRWEAEAGTGGEVEESEKKSKRSKHTQESASDAALDTPTTSNPPTKKKRKNKTGFPDPEEDKSLPSQSQKCPSDLFY
ncbi:hypothetical protein H0H81_001996, partial [Sphagnurus paluster]